MPEGKEKHMSKKILVIDDEAEVCNLLETFLKKQGYESISTTSASEGLEKLRSERPDAVLLDIRMPDMDGIEVMRRIRTINKDIPIIMATAVVDKKVAQDASDLGATDYIIKPFDLDYLKKVLLVKLAMLT